MSADSKEGKAGQSITDRKRKKHDERGARQARKRAAREGRQQGTLGQEHQPPMPVLASAGQVITGTVVEVARSGIVLSWGRNQSGFLPEALMDEETRKSYQSLGQRMKEMIDVHAVVKNTMIGEGDGQKVRLTQQADQFRVQVGERFNVTLLEVLDIGVKVEIIKDGWTAEKIVGKGNLVGGRNRLRFVRQGDPLEVEVIGFREIHAVLKEVVK